MMTIAPKLSLSGSGCPTKSPLFGTGMGHVTDTLWNAVLPLLVNAKILVRSIYKNLPSFILGGCGIKHREDKVRVEAEGVSLPSQLKRIPQLGS
jgi:hypothetical protein